MNNGRMKSQTSEVKVYHPTNGAFLPAGSHFDVDSDEEIWDT